MEDHIIRATAANESIRAFAISGKGLAEEARRRHNSSPVVTAALSRLLCAGAMMSATMKGKDDVLTIVIRGDGPIGTLTVTANSKGDIKGYAANPQVIIPSNYAGKLDVGAAVGCGELTVIKDLGLKEPYSGTVPLGTGEIAEDLTYYFARSEQTPTAIGLGESISLENTVECAGGFMIQLMPDTPGDIIDALEKSLSGITSVSQMLKGGMTPEDILRRVLGFCDLEIKERLPVRFHCGCSKEYVARALVSMGKKELQDIIDDGKAIEVKCSFCNSAYNYSVDEIKELLVFAKVKNAAKKLGFTGGDKTED